ncbi:unnamed protein product [Alopecurus aequalis]
MLPYTTEDEVEAALGRAMTWAEAVWFRYSAVTPDYCLYCHHIVIFLVIYTLSPLPLALLELRAPVILLPYKLQPRVRLSPAASLRCYVHTVGVFLLAMGPVQLLSYPAVKMVGIRTGLPLPSAGESAAQMVVYLLLEDYLGYWMHRLLHTKLGYEKIHHVHHEFTAPIGYAGPYGHWADVLILGFPAFVGPAVVPCHMTVFWLWFVIRQLAAMDAHKGFDFPLNPAKFIPFYGGAPHHDFHHRVGGKSQSNFASIFTFCDYLYGTEKGYKHHKASLAKLKKMTENNNEDR